MEPRRTLTLLRLGVTACVIGLVSACSGAGTPTTGATAAASTVPVASVPATPVVTEVPPAQLTGSLSVLEWGGYETPDFWVDFKNTYPKVDVAFTFGTTDADI